MYNTRDLLKKLLIFSSTADNCAYRMVKKWIPILQCYSDILEHATLNNKFNTFQSLK